MLNQILECSRCSGKFEFTYDGRLPGMIVCGCCKAKLPAADFSAMRFCPHCRAKLSMPLEMIGSERLRCPRCGREFGDDTLQESPIGTGDAPQGKKRLLQNGVVFEKYAIDRFISEGGMSEVYLARHVFLNRRCALKILKPSAYSGDHAYEKRFMREVSISFQVDSPDIVTVYDAGRDPATGYFFIAMEYVEGQNLQQEVQHRRFSEMELRQVGSSMARALKVLASHGIVHRDIKPANIMRRKDGSFCLMDMGIATVTTEHNGMAGTMTMANGMAGTPAYCSPEQCRSPQLADVRSDIYSLGATLYHLACGRPPFEGTTTMDVMLNVLRSPVPPLQRLKTGLSPDIASVIMKMMDREPAHRLQTPEDVEAAMANEPRKRRRGWILAGCGAVAAGMLLGLLYMATQLVQGELDVKTDSSVSPPPSESQVPGSEQTAVQATIEATVPASQRPVSPPPSESQVPGSEKTAVQATIEATVPASQRPVSPPPSESQVPGSEKTAVQAPIEATVPASQKHVKDSESEFDLSGLVSGMPPVKKSVRRFNAAEHLDMLGQVSRPPHGRSDMSWQDHADLNMAQALQQLDVWNVYALLELGYDINSRTKYNGRMCPIGEQCLLRHHFTSPYTGLCKEEFVRMFLFLMENGLDLNVYGGDGVLLIDKLLKICSLNDDPVLWRLIPYSLAHGVALDTYSAMSIGNTKLEQYVAKALKAKGAFRLPATAAEVRPDDMRQSLDVGRFKVRLPQKQVPILEPSYAGSHHHEFSGLLKIENNGIWKDWQSFGDAWPKLDGYSPEDIQDFLRNGIHPQVMIMRKIKLYWTTPADEPLLAHVAMTPEAVACLLENGSRMGLQQIFDNCRDPKIRTLLWEYGAFVTPRRIVQCTEKGEYEFLLGLYRKQQCRYGHLDTVTGNPAFLRDDQFWNHQRAIKAINQQDKGEFLRILDDIKDVNFIDPAVMKESLLMEAVQSGDDDIVKALLKRGANPDAKARVKGYWSLTPFEYAVLTFNVPLAQRLWRTQKVSSLKTDRDGHSLLCLALQTALHKTGHYENRVWKEHNDCYNDAPSQPREQDGNFTFRLCNIDLTAIARTGRLMNQEITSSIPTFIAMVDFLTETAGCRFHKYCAKVASSSSSLSHPDWCLPTHPRDMENLQVLKALLDWLVQHDMPPSRGWFSAVQASYDASKASKTYKPSPKYKEFVDYVKKLERRLF